MLLIHLGRGSGVRDILVGRRFFSKGVRWIIDIDTSQTYKTQLTD